MATGKKNQQNPKSISKIVEAIEEAERHTTGEIRVHISRKWFEKDPYGHAMRLFQEFGMSKTTQRNAVLFYINVKKHKFAIIGDEGIHHVVGQRYWEELAHMLREDLQSTHIENAVSLAVRTIGSTLRKFFPLPLDGENPNELGDHVSSDP